MKTLDSRVHPYRSDLAAVSLKGQVKAKRFVKGSPRVVIKGCVDMVGMPKDDTPLISQLLFGETFTVYEEKNGWAWGQGAADGYVGYIRSAYLGKPKTKPTHRVSALRTFTFSKPTVKISPLDTLSMGSLVTVKTMDGNWLQLRDKTWIPKVHLTPIVGHPFNIITTARCFLGTPYLWGGRSSLGIDCSGLVQICLNMANMPCLRDSDQQAETIGRLISKGGKDVSYKAGDAVFFPDHVGLMTDSKHIIHANATSMDVKEEPLVDVVKRGLKITAVRRLPPQALKKV